MGELEREFKYKRMKTIHDINMQLMQENSSLKEQLKMLDSLNTSSVTKQFFKTLSKKQLTDFRLWCLRNGKIMRRVHLLSHNIDYLQKLWAEYSFNFVINPYQKLEQQNSVLRECIRELRKQARIKAIDEMISIFNNQWQEQAIAFTASTHYIAYVDLLKALESLKSASQSPDKS